ncbi:hypothetical protein B0T26DRAFT_724294 [Lasiosphaeria miniovina]|uniref:Uncharacterized protein n=1 Tax=Lasiosphaeria miniovina TaxID=1954250 RepID=A0AA40A6L8_9PEZI|nr:uncharacterized protein B0T26DRAFT_724294 [Lasiosphaeria miniovina]KAK0710185.1 hypothetical protein B0T26DRAFT_724294 [Lasiosphaeria miniovina]
MPAHSRYLFQHLGFLVALLLPSYYGAWELIGCHLTSLRWRWDLGQSHSCGVIFLIWLCFSNLQSLAAQAAAASQIIPKVAVSQATLSHGMRHRDCSGYFRSSSTTVCCLVNYVSEPRRPNC